MGNIGVEVIIPILATLFASSKIGFVGMEKKLFGNSIPFILETIFSTLKQAYFDIS